SCRRQAMSVCFATTLCALAGYVVFLASLCAIDEAPSQAEHPQQHLTERLQERSMSSLRLPLLCILLAILPVAGSSQPLSGKPAWLTDLLLGGYVIVLRHGATVSNEANTDSMNRSDASGERPLNAEGRAQAKSIGESMHKLDIPVHLVLTSPVQRAV